MTHTTSNIQERESGGTVRASGPAPRPPVPSASRVRLAGGTMQTSHDAPTLDEMRRRYAELTEAQRAEAVRRLRDMLLAASEEGGSR
jgi:hypothetical protein